MGKSIFELTEKTGYQSPWDEDWTKSDFSGAASSASSDYTKQSVHKYTHPHKTSFAAARDKGRTDRHKKYLEYKAYYEKIGKIKPGATEKEIWNAFSDANRTELNRFENEVIDVNQQLYDKAVADEKQWNKLDTHIEDVTHDFNKRKGYKGDKQLHPDLVKALMFAETEMGLSSDYQILMIQVPKKNLASIYQLNLGRVTDRAGYNKVVKEFNIPVNETTNYKDLGNKNDVMLCTGDLMIKQRYSVVPTVVSKNKQHLNGDMWFNAVVAYKGVSAEGNRKAKLAYKLFEKGEHPYTLSFKLF